MWLSCFGQRLIPGEILTNHLHALGTMLFQLCTPLHSLCVSCNLNVQYLCEKVHTPKDGIAEDLLEYFMLLP